MTPGQTPRPIRDEHEAQERHRGHWYDTDTLRFFGSRPDYAYYPATGGARSYFVSSERDRGYQGSDGLTHGAWGGQRRYTVRVIDWRTGDIDEPSGESFGAYAALETARRHAAAAAAADTVGEYAYPCPTHGTDYARELSESAGVCYACAERSYQSGPPSHTAVIAQARANRRAVAIARRVK